MCRVCLFRTRPDQRKFGTDRGHFIRENGKGRKVYSFLPTRERPWVVITSTVDEQVPRTQRDVDDTHKRVEIWCERGTLSGGLTERSSTLKVKE